MSRFPHVSGAGDAFEDLTGTVGNVVFEAVGRVMSSTQERKPLPVDLLEGEDAYLAVFDAPGAMGSDVKVRYVDRTVEVQVDRFREFREDYDLKLPGRGLVLDGKVTLPVGDPVDPSGATATLQDDGTLHVRVPKRPAETAEGGSDGEASETDENDRD